MGEFFPNTDIEASEKGMEANSQSAWQRLGQEVSFNGAGAQAGHETDSPKYENELNSPADVLNDVKNFVIKDGKVYQKETGELETDEDTILRAKTSRFLFNEAKARHDEDVHQFGDRLKDHSPESYVDYAMKKYAIRDEENTFGPNKVINSLLKNQILEEPFLGDDIDGSKFSMFTGKKEDYGKALLRRKFRQRGVDLKNFELSFDDSPFAHNGYSNVSIKIELKPLERSGNST